MRKGLTAMGALVAALALVAAGCGGGGGSSLTKDEYVSRLNAICKDYNTVQNEIGSPSTVDELQTKGKQIADEFERAIGRVKDLNPPTEIADTANAFVTNAEDQLSLIRDLIDAAKASDQQKMQDLITRGDELSTEGDNLSKELGATECRQ